MKYFKPADEADFLECIEHAAAQLAEELARPADQLEPRRIRERAGKLYDRAGGSWVPNDTGWRFDNE